MKITATATPRCFMRILRTRNPTAGSSPTEITAAISTSTRMLCTCLTASRTATVSTMAMVVRTQ